MWKQILSNKGIGVEMLPSKTKKMIDEYNEMEEGIAEMQNEIQSEQDPEVRKEISEDIQVLNGEMSKLSNKIVKEIQYLKLNADGTLGQYTQEELQSSFQSRIEGYNPESKTKTKSIF